MMSSRHVFHHPVTLGFTTACLWVALSMTACSDEVTPPDAGPEAGPMIDGGPLEDAGAPLDVAIRFFHASPNSERISLTAGALRLGEAAYGELLHGLTVSIPPDSESVTIEVAATDGESPPPIATLEVTREVGNAPQLIILAGDRASSRVNQQAQLCQFEDRIGTEAESGSRVRWVNATWGLFDVTLDVGRDNPTDPEIPYWPRFSATPAAGYEVLVGAPHRVGIVTTFARYLRGFSLPELEAESRIFAVVAGDHDADVRTSTGLRIFLVGPDNVTERAIDPEFFFLNAITSDGASALRVDGYVGGTLTFPSQMFGLFNNNQVYRRIVDSSSEHVTIHQQGDDPMGAASLLDGMAGPFELGQRYVVVATGHLASDGAISSGSIMTVNHDLPIRNDDEDDTYIRFVHAAPRLPATVDLGYRTGARMRTGGGLFSGVRLGESSAAGGSVISGSEDATLAVTTAGSDLAEFPFGSYPIRSSARYLAVLVGAASDAHANTYRLVLFQPWTEVQFGSQDASSFYATNIRAER